MAVMGGGVSLKNSHAETLSARPSECSFIWEWGCGGSDSSRWSRVGRLGF